MNEESMESIREELVSRVNALPEMNRQVDKSELDLSFASTASHLMATPTFAAKITGTVDNILLERGLVLSDAERKDLRRFLKPTQTELLKKYMQQ